MQTAITAQSMCIVQCVCIVPWPVEGGGLSQAGTVVGGGGGGCSTLPAGVVDFTVARWSKILKNNLKRAARNIF